MNFFDYFKSLFGIGNKDKSADIDGLEEFINELKDKYTQTEQDLPKYERKEPVVQTDEEIRDEAEKSLADYYKGKKDDIESDYEWDLRKKQSNKEKLERQLGNELDNIAEEFEEAKTRANNDSIRKGVARSSIAGEKIQKLDNAREREETLIGEEYASKIKDTDAEIEELEAKRNKALNDLNISYAARLADKINKLLEARRKILDEALEYNNELEKREREEKLAAENGKSFKPDEDFFRQVYLKADEMLSKMNHNDARNAVNNNEILKEYLNDYYYYKLYEKYCK